MSDDNDDNDRANSIGIWIFRSTIVIGIVVCGCLDKKEAVEGLTVGLIWSFLFL